jgi:hypothetical protein
MDSTMVTVVLGQLGEAATQVKSLLTGFIPIIAGVAVLALAVGLVPKLIKRVGGSA